jgi:hypothetical protein
MVIDDYQYWGEEIRRVGGVVSDVCLRHNCLIAIVPFTLAEWHTEGTLFAGNVRREGVAVP